MSGDFLNNLNHRLFWQYFLNPKDPKEPVPPQLEQLANTIIVPLLAVFHRLVEQVWHTLPIHVNLRVIYPSKIKLRVIVCFWCHTGSF